MMQKVDPFFITTDDGKKNEQNYHTISTFTLHHHHHHHRTTFSTSSLPHQHSQTSLRTTKNKKTREKKFGTNLTDVRDPGSLLLQRRRHQVNGHRRAHLRVDDNLKVKAAKVLAAGRRGAPSSAIFGGRRVGGRGGIGGGNGGKGNGRAACCCSTSSTTSTGFAGVTGRRAQ